MYDAVPADGYVPHAEEVKQQDQPPAKRPRRLSLSHEDQEAGVGENESLSFTVEDQDEDLSYYLEDGLDDVDWDGILPEESDRIAESIFSPSQRKLGMLDTAAEAVNKEGSITSSPLQDLHRVSGSPYMINAKKLPLNTSSASEGYEVSATQRTSSSQEYDYAAQEAELLQRYNLPAHMRANVTTDALASIGFASARGKAFSVSSEALARAALRLRGAASSSPEGPQTADTAFAPAFRPLTVSDDSSIDTPLQARNRQFNVSLLPDTSEESVRPGSTPYLRPTIQPLRFNPKKGHPHIPSKLQIISNGQSEGIGAATKSDQDEESIEQMSDDLPFEDIGRKSGDDNLLLAGLASGFTSGNGKQIAAPSAEAVAKAIAKMDGSQGHIQEIGLMITPEAVEGGFTRQSPASFSTASGASVSVPCTDIVHQLVQRSDNRSGSLHADRTRLPDEQGLAEVYTAVATPARDPLAWKNANNADSSISASQKVKLHLHSVNKPFKIPRSNNPSTPTTSKALPVRTSQVGFPKLSLSMTPRNTQSAAINRSTFKTPFKNGLRPSVEQLKSLHRETKGTPIKQSEATMKNVLVHPGHNACAASQKGKEIIKSDSVFDMYTYRQRVGMEQYGLNPRYTVNRLIDAGLPNEVIFMTLQQALSFKFDGQFGHDLAFEELVYYGGCKGINQAWIQNHWALIVWKVAAYIRSKPDELKNWWSFEHVCIQLKHRYEREILLSQRSCIKRIQERDSAAGRTMILLVTDVITEEREIPPEPGSDDALQGIVQTEVVPVALELSDGWYRIRTTGIDDSLYRAVCFKKIFIGMKLKIHGAKLDGGGEGGEPLEAYESSTLSISGNSTTRVKWHAKLGFVRPQLLSPWAQCICTFRSLLPDGGFVPAVEIEIIKIYPVGFKGEYEEGKKVDIWNEGEEVERKKLWERERSNTQYAIRQEQLQRFQKLQSIQEKLLLAFNTRQRSPKEILAKFIYDDAGLSDFVEVFNYIEEETEKAPICINRLSHSTLKDTIDYAAKKLERYQAGCNDELWQELEKRCPPRVARPFCEIRVKDCRDRDPLGGSRECRLQVSDPYKLGRDFLSEGRRYLVSNLYPSQLTSWSSPQSINGEIFLTTRSHSSWHRLS